MRTHILTLSFFLSCIIQLTSQVDIKIDAPALLQICVRDTKNIESISCTDREIMKIAVTEVMRIKTFSKPNTVINLDIQIAVNEKGTITDVLTNKNSNTLETLVSKKLQAIGTLFPARKNGVFVPSILKYHIDDATLTDYILIDNREGIIVGSYEMAPPVIVLPPDYTTNPGNYAIPFAIIEEPPSTKKCAKLKNSKEKRDCFYEFMNDFIEKPLRKQLNKLENADGQRIIINFIIDTEGNAVDVRVRSKNTDLEKELLKIMEKFPQVIPGKQRGRFVGTQINWAYKS